MRKRIYQTVHIYEGSTASRVYKYAMIGVILLSLIPLTVKERPPVFVVTDIACLAVFVADYLLRWITADYKFQKEGWRSFLRYPFRPISIIDLLAIFALCSAVFGWFSEGGLAPALSVFRTVRIFRYSKSVRIILGILQRSRKPLAAVGGLAVGYILISAVVIFNVEPQSFENFFDAVYWATVSLTTVGYGDIYPISVIGRAVAMLSSFFGIAIVALPAGIVTAEFIQSLRPCKEDDHDQHTGTDEHGNR